MDYVLQGHFPGAIAVSHQCRRFLYAGRTCDRAGGGPDVPAAQKELVEDIFACCDAKVIVSVTDAIGEPIKEETI